MRPCGHPKNYGHVFVWGNDTTSTDRLSTSFRGSRAKNDGNWLYSNSNSNLLIWFGKGVQTCPTRSADLLILEWMSLYKALEIQIRVEGSLFLFTENQLCLVCFDEEAAGILTCDNTANLWNEIALEDKTLTKTRAGWSLEELLLRTNAFNLSTHFPNRRKYLYTPSKAAWHFRYSKRDSLMSHRLTTLRKLIDSVLVLECNAYSVFISSKL